MHEHYETIRIQYGNGATFIPVCEKCHRFVMADKSIFVNTFTERCIPGTNAICSKCGRTKMLFEGFMLEIKCTA